MKKTLATILSIALATASLVVMPGTSSAVTKDVFCKMTAKHEANKVVIPKAPQTFLFKGKNSEDNPFNPNTQAVIDTALKKKADVYKSVYAECMA